MSPRDVYYRLLEEKEDELVSLVAYAIFETARYRWLEKRERMAKPPSDEEATTWIADFDIERAIGDAKARLHANQPATTKQGAAVDDMARYHPKSDASCADQLQGRLQRRRDNGRA
jgi:hypothetical protein